MEIATDTRASVRKEDGYSEAKDLELLAFVMLYGDYSFGFGNHLNTPNFVTWLEDDKRANHIDGVYRRMNEELGSIESYTFRIAFDQAGKDKGSSDLNPIRLGWEEAR